MLFSTPSSMPEVTPLEPIMPNASTTPFHQMRRVVRFIAFNAIPMPIYTFPYLSFAETHHAARVLNATSVMHGGMTLSSYSSTLSTLPVLVSEANCVIELTPSLVLERRLDARVAMSIWRLVCWCINLKRGTNVSGKGLQCGMAMQGR